MTTKPIPPRVRALIERIAAHVPRGESSVLLAQVRSAAVTNEVPGRVLDFLVPHDEPRSTIPDGPVRPIPAVTGPGGQLAGELILWIRAGRLIGLEQPWFGDEPPTSWPEESSLDFS